MSAQQERIVAIARTWLGTAYVHQASCKGAGTDCLGLLRGVWREVLGAEPEKTPAYGADWGEVGQQEILFNAACRHLIKCPLADEQIGDVLLFRMREGSVAKHLGLQSVAGGQRRFIHAYTGHGVIENALSSPWRRRIVARFRFPEGDV